MIPGTNPSGPMRRLAIDNASEAIASPLVRGGGGAHDGNGGGATGSIASPLVRGGCGAGRGPAGGGSGTVAGAAGAGAGGGTHRSPSTRRLVVTFGLETMNTRWQFGHVISVPT